MDEKNPYQLFILAYALSSFSGLAALLRSERVLSRRLICSSMLNSGLFGIAVAMVWRELYGEARYPWFMLGVSVFAGLGGTSLIDFTFTAAQEGLRLYAIRAGQSLPIPGTTHSPPAVLPSTPTDPSAEPQQQ